MSDNNIIGGAGIKHNLCPLDIVIKFCYRFVNLPVRQRVASTMFDAGKIWARGWDLYGVRSAAGTIAIFVPTEQLLHLMQEIRRQFPSAISRSTQGYIEKNVLFDSDSFPPRLRPQALGSCRSRDQYSDRVEQLDHYTHPEGITEEDWQIYETLIAHACAMCRPDGEQRNRQRQKGQMLLNNAQHQLEHARQILGINMHLKTEGSTRRPSFAQSPQDYILFAIDIEAMETCKSAITEIGIAILDTRDLMGKPPGDFGRSWQPLIQARHFRVEEYATHVNHIFVRGCPTAFEFGTSEFVASADIALMLDQCLQCPAASAATELDEAGYAARRKVMLVGHNIASDISFLTSIGVDVMNRRNVDGALDTQSLYRAVSAELQPRSLGHVLLEFDFKAWNLHNAGNDAVYTLWALLACVLR